MTVAITDYFETTTLDRKKETRYIAVINQNSCTSCESCATMCPVDCIYEIPSRVPSQSFHQIDTSRCIGCQLCYRVPTMSNEHYTLEICPWNAIDMVYNPNVKLGEPVLAPYYSGQDTDVPWAKLEEFAYQAYLNECLNIRATDSDLNEILSYFTESQWSWGEGTFNVLNTPEDNTPFLTYHTTENGLLMLKTIFEDYQKLFLD